MTPLHHAVKHGHRLMTLMLLARGNIKIDQKDNQGNTPLMHAFIEKARTKEEQKQKQYDVIVRKLLDLGATAVSFDH
ncbi:hypothetical protein BB8028_0003g15400 [Beauveria bassiana]|uniref:Uncharacterized protein n=1 Tax=Beauveria bassiana TaxID=176275 RepID=A0A2S7Y9V6_BEABA|nr:hypothetical protein BB8028_0003g15400 [Beauveria bassiana]